jgi:glycosyltransferase involved in cell wall biosynthesis
MSESKKIKIAINAIAALQGGGVTYLNQVILEWGNNETVQVDVYGFKNAADKLKAFDNIHLLDVPEEVYSNLRARNRYEKKVLPKLFKEGEYDVAYYPSGTIPGKLDNSIKTVTMFQNMLPFSIRDVKKFSFKARLRYHLLKFLFLKSFRKADHVIFISNFAKSVIRKHIVDIDTKSSVIVHGINDEFRLKPNYHKDSYLLYVSILNVYKHQKELVEGLAQFKENNGWAPKIKFVGFIKENYLDSLKQLVAKLGLEEEVDIYGPAKHSEIPDLYEKSKAVVFASTCENCPIILLEAMASGKAIFCSNFQPMPEFLEDNGYYFNPEKSESFTKVLEEYINNHEDLKLKGQLAKEKSDKWIWSATAEQTMDVFRALANEN